MKDSLRTLVNDRRAAVREDAGFMAGLPRRIRLRELRIVPTRFGVVFGLIVVSMLMGSINYHNNLGFLFTFILASIAVVSLPHSIGNLGGIRIVDAQAPPAFAGRRAWVDLRIAGSKPHHHAVAFGFDTQTPVVVNLGQNDKQRISVPLERMQRGIVPIGRLVVFSRYPLGLFECRVRIDLHRHVVVYPRPLDAKAVATGELLRTHDEGQGAAVRIDDFKGLRPYQPGDALQHIFWKPFAKGQGLVIKEFEGQAHPALLIRWERVKGENVEARLSRMCTMVLRASALHLRYGIQLPTRRIRPAEGEDHKHRCLRALAAFGGKSSPNPGN